MYGMASDFIPIMGYHRIPYVCIAGALSTTAFNILANMKLDVHVAVLVLFCAQLAVATPGFSFFSFHFTHHPIGYIISVVMVENKIILCFFFH